MEKIESVLRKIRRVALASFKNAVRLHEDAILLFDEDRFPSALHTTVLSVEEIGKYFMYEDVWWFNRVGSPWPLKEIQKWLRGTYSHISKQRRFVRDIHSPIFSKPLLRDLLDGQLELIKQKATYVGLSRKKNNIDFEKRMTTPFRTSNRRADEYITMVNDYFVELAIGIRKGVYIIDIREINDWLANPEVEQKFRKLWPKMRPSTKRRVDKMLKWEDDLSEINW